MKWSDSNVRTDDNGVRPVRRPGDVGSGDGSPVGTYPGDPLADIEALFGIVDPMRDVGPVLDSAKRAVAYLRGQETLVAELGDIIHLYGVPLKPRDHATYRRARLQDGDPTPERLAVGVERDRAEAAAYGERE